MKWSKKTLQTNSNCNITYYTYNSHAPGPPIIFLHGFSGSSLAWKKTHQSIKNPSIFIDLRGHGLSSRSKSLNFYSMENFISDIKKIIKHEGLNQVILIGHCFGGMLALEYVKKYSFDVRKLIIINSADSLPRSGGSAKQKSSFLEKIINFLPDVGITRYENFDKLNFNTNISLYRIFRGILFTHIHSFFSIFYQMRRYDFTKKSNQIKAPTTIIYGNKDKIIPPKLSISLHNKIKESKLIKINSAHVSILQMSQKISQIISKETSSIV